MADALQLIAQEKINKTGILNLGYCGLTELPEELFELVWLQTLDLRNNQITDISFLKGLTNLQTLDLRNNQLTDISFLSGLTSLQRLYLSSNKLTDISYLSDLTSLQRLDLSSNQLTEISFLKGLTTLQILDLSYNQLTEISFLKGLTTLQILNLSYNQLTDISYLSGMTTLQALVLSSNKLTNISYLSGLTSLQTLYLGFNQLTDISYLSGLTTLQTLYLSSNKITDYSYLSGLTTLQTLYLSSNKITDYSFLSGLTSLQTLYLSSNKITDYSYLSGLTSLQTLDLSSNQLTDIESLLPLIRLGKMEVSLKQLDWGGKINLYDNPITNPPIEIVQQGNQAIIDYFDSLKGLSEEEKRPIKEIKILLVGQGEAGKTSLLKRFKGLEFNKKESQTHGIIIEKLALDKLPVFKNNGDLKGITGRFWDFGGQEIMHASHQFFLTNRSVYVLVIDSRNDTKHEYWLQHIEKYSGDNSDVFIAINKTVDNPNFDLKRVHLNQKYPFIKNQFYKISCKENKGIKELTTAISQAIPQNAMLTTAISIYWHQVKEALEIATAKSHYIDETTFKAICERNNVLKPSEQKTLLGLLNALGIVLHFEKLSLKSFFVLDPHWVTIGVYKIINSAKVVNGILNCRDLSFILNKEIINKEEYDPYQKKQFKYKSDEELYLINIMESFELTYPLIKDDQYLVPNLLPVEALEPLSIDDTNDDHIHFILQYDFLPNSIMTRFIVRMKDDITNYNQLWRTGVVLNNQKFGACALVKADEEEKRITICVSGISTGKRAYFSVIHHTLWAINNSFQDLKPKQLMTVPNHRDIEVDYDDLLRREQKNRDELYISKLDKDFSVSKDFLDKISTKAERMKKENEKGGFIQHNIFNAPVQGVGQNENLTQKITPPLTEKPKTEEKPEPLKKWYEFHWVKSLGKALLISVPIAIISYVLQKEAIINFDYTLEASAIIFCFVAVFFISRDPKYKFYRGGMLCISLIGLTNILPFLNSKSTLSKPLEDGGNFEWVFKLGIQDSPIISIGLFVVALYLFYRQK